MPRQVQCLKMRTSPRLRSPGRSLAVHLKSLADTWTMTCAPAAGAAGLSWGALLGRAAAACASVITTGTLVADMAGCWSIGDAAAATALGLSSTGCKPVKACAGMGCCTGVSSGKGMLPEADMIATTSGALPAATEGGKPRLPCMLLPGCTQAEGIALPGCDMHKYGSMPVDMAGSVGGCVAVMHKGVCAGVA